MACDAAGGMVRSTSPTGTDTTDGNNHAGQLEFTIDQTGNSTYYICCPPTHQKAEEFWKTTKPE